MLSTRISSRIVQFTTQVASRNASSKSTLVPIQLATTKDESTIVAWHKAEDFPYECTKPLPEVKMVESDTVLKTQMSEGLYDLYNRKHPDLARLDLMKITHTTKHRWFQRARDKKAKKTPMDRQYL